LRDIHTFVTSNINGIPNVINGERSNGSHPSGRTTMELSEKTTPDHGTSLDDLHELFGASLQRFALHLTGDYDLAQDLVQETLIRVFTHQNLVSSLNFYQQQAWMYRTLKNKFLDDKRKDQRASRSMAQLISNYLRDEQPIVGCNLHDLLDQVPEKDRELLHQHFILGMKGEEIAQELGIPAATVRSRIFLAIKRLRKIQEG
jgi:RNA polymerase sigma-70 factor, ECF subfamily